jgi:NhaA family Na+:H+ antiporter
MAFGYRHRLGIRKDVANIFSILTHSSSVGGIILILCTIAALIVANLFTDSTMFLIWETPLLLKIGSFKIEMDILTFVNDVLMALFFFVVGLEIKREMLVGELSSLKQASLPIFAAIGGMVAPALIFYTINAGTNTQHGWGIPMATDIAFTLGAISLLGKRVPISIKIFLTALAIVDDIGSIIVLAIFYPSHPLQLPYLYYALGVLLILIIFNRLNVNRSSLFIIPGLFLWYFVYESGIHATIAGVLLAMTIPAKTQINEVRFFTRSSYYLSKFKKMSNDEVSILANSNQLDIIHNLHSYIRKINPPINRFEHRIHPWITFSIMPLFAFANARVDLSGFSIETLFGKVSTGIFAGLVFGKPLGIFLASMVACKLGLAKLPKETTRLQLLSAGILAGIGFTMSIFIDGLAFKDPFTINQGKASILIASTIAAIIGLIALYYTTKKKSKR